MCNASSSGRSQSISPRSGALARAVLGEPLAAQHPSPCPPHARVWMCNLENPAVVRWIRSH
eukprot:scaffold62041_cov69-Phaeocystis_antarctica.AAC.4